MKMTNQKGIATILLVMLVGISVLVGVVGVATSLNTNKESSIASHAQTNVELMTWAGVSAFRQYLEKTGAEDVANVTNLAGQEITLKDSDNQEIKVKNILIHGCADIDGICSLQADIMSFSKTGKSAATIQTLFNLEIREGVVVPATRREATYTAGSSHFLGTKLDSEVANTKLNLNIDGDFTVIPFLTKFEVSENITEISVNVDGDVYIDCFFGCDKPRMDITATGKVTLLNGGEYGDIKANGKVTLGSLVERAPKVYSDSDSDNDDSVVNPDTDENDDEEMDIEDEDGNTIRVPVKGLTSGSITTNGDVLIRSSYVQGNVLAGGNVILKRDSTVTGSIKSNKSVSLEGMLLANPAKTQVLGDVTAVLDVKVSKATIKRNVQAGRDVDVRNAGIIAGGSYVKSNGNTKVTLRGEVVANIFANGYVDVVHGGKVTGDIHAGHWVRVRFPNSKVTGNVYARGDITRSHDSGVYIAGLGDKVVGNVYTMKDVVVVAGKKILGNVYLTGSHRVENAAGGKALIDRQTGSIKKESADSLLALINSGLPVAGVTAFSITPVALDVGTKIDVKKYKPDANYIFSEGKERGASRIYLNHLKNQATGITYMYEGGEQKAYDASGNAVAVNKDGFYLGKYKYGGHTYVGAICESVDLQTSLLYKSGECTSPIVGFFTRVGVGTDVDLGEYLFGLPQAYGYDPLRTSILQDWYLRSRGGAKSKPDNANLAPGILYFEGHVDVKGDIAFDGSEGNAYTNTILAEGHINAVEWSPRIYSPFNIVREGDASLICDRTIKPVDGGEFNKNATDPLTQSDKFLVPTNLCEDNDSFSYSMNKDEDGNVIKFDIGGKEIDKLNLGYVALMSNDIVRVGSCAKIFGDVLARKRIEGSTAEVGRLDLCGGGSTGQAITGIISVEGTSTSFFLDGTIIIVPDEKYTNEGEEVPADANENDSIESVLLRWTKFL